MPGSVVASDCGGGEVRGDVSDVQGCAHGRLVHHGLFKTFKLERKKLFAISILFSSIARGNVYKRVNGEIFSA